MRLGPAIGTAGAALVLAVSAGARELTSAYIVTAVANNPGAGGTDWHSDLTLYNPHDHALPVVLQFLPTGRDNSGGVATVELELFPWETLNLWDVLGPQGFDARGQIGALLAYADDQRIDCGGVASACDFAVFSRTYTLRPGGGAGEYGQALPGFPSHLGLDWSVIAYLPQAMNDGEFRTNLGVASWTASFVRIRLELQDPDGAVIDRQDVWLPPFGHAHWRMQPRVTGGTVAVWILDGPADAMVYPYASVVNEATGDPVNVEAQLTTVGLTAQAARVRAARPAPARETVPGFERGRLSRERR
jgi:hypothetical protein